MLATGIQGARFRIPNSDHYLLALGRAVYCFSYLEWQAAWCWNKMAPGSIDEAHKLTARQIAGKFLNCIEGGQIVGLTDAMLPAAEKFHFLAGRRNELIHSNPGTTTNGDPALFRDGSSWTIEQFNLFADECADCAIKLNELFYSAEA